MLSPNRCEDEQGFVIGVKKLPEISADKGYLTLKTAELLPKYS